MIDSKIEKELMDEYRQITIQKIKEAIEDAKEIVSNEFPEVNSPYYAIIVSGIARTIFDKRISPYHYWKQKKILEKSR